MRKYQDKIKKEKEAQQTDEYPQNTRVVASKRRKTKKKERKRKEDVALRKALEKQEKKGG